MIIDVITFIDISKSLLKSYQIFLGGGEVFWLTGRMPVPRGYLFLPHQPRHVDRRFHIGQSVMRIDMIEPVGRCDRVDNRFPSALLRRPRRPKRQT